MKHLYLTFTLLLILSATAQNYDSNWNRVIGFENAGRIESANRETSKILRKAKSDRNEAQIIKCFFYQSKYMHKLEEDSQQKIYDNLEKTIAFVSLPSQAILQVVRAQCLESHVSNNYNKLYARTDTGDEGLGNLATWTSATFTQQIEDAYSKSLANTALLKKTPLAGYEQVFDFLSIEKFNKQNLYGYVLRENIRHYTKTRSYLNHLANTMDAAKLLGDTTAFTAVIPNDTLDPKFTELFKLYQEAERNDPSAENRLERLCYFHRILEHDEALCLKAFDRLLRQEPDERLRQNILLEKTQIYMGSASKTDFPEGNIMALASLDSVLATENRSNAWQQARSKKNNLAAKSLSLQMVTFLYAKEQTRAFITFKNIDTLSAAYYKIDIRTMDSLRIGNHRMWMIDTITKARPVVAFKQPLQVKKDYFSYTTEILLPPLETGIYIAYFEHVGPIPEEKIYSYQVVTVSDLMLTERTTNGVDRFTVVNRETGSPVSDATVMTNKFSLVSDSRGQIAYTRPKAKDDNQYEWIRVIKGNDTLQLGRNYFYGRTYDDTDDEDIDAKVVFYLDRAIYRPGQTVFYKGIAVQQRKGKTSVVGRLTFDVFVEDPEGNEIKKILVTTNETGSFWGEFTIPKSVMTGNFEIYAEEPDEEAIEKDPEYNRREEEHPFWDYVIDFEGRLRFQVEEYKRPKFEAAFDPVKENFKIGDKITVTGKARAFSGGSISNAKVTYSIRRTNYSNYSGGAVIETNEATTDSSGKFTIAFTATAGDDDHGKTNYNYYITASVTDTDGETRETQTNVKAGPIALVLNVKMPSLVRAKDKGNIKLISQNLNGQFAPAEATVRIYFLKPFAPQFKERLFSPPEIEMIPKPQFESLFPYEQADLDFTLPEKPIAVKQINTAKKDTLALDFITPYRSGYYRAVIIAADQWGNPVTAEADFQILQDSESFSPANLLTLEPLNADPKKDGFILLAVHSPIAALSVGVTAIHENKIIHETDAALDNHKAVIKIPIEKTLSGQVKIGADTVFDNQFFTQETDIEIKAEKPAMTITAETFRSKIEPGGNEHWTFNISPSRLASGAEVLASMYDRSLDEFRWSNWTTELGFETPANYRHEKTPLGFKVDYPQVFNLTQRHFKTESRNEETSLIWFGFDFNDKADKAQIRKYKTQRSKKMQKPAKARMVTGIVSDATGTLPGANVLIKGTERGVQADVDGYFEIEAAPGEEIVFSFVGMRDKTITVGGTRNINVTLDVGGMNLQEVVIEGYGGLKTKKSLAYAATTVTTESLQGRVAGINIERDDAGTIKVVVRGISSINPGIEPLLVVDGTIVSAKDFGSLGNGDIQSVTILKDAGATAIYGNRGSNGVIVVTTKKAVEKLIDVKIRKNLSETAFFFPDLKPDKNGRLTLDFTSPEALTEWKLRLFAHNKDAVTGYLQSIVTTQKDLMAIPNFPRFFREKDTIWVSAKISNLTAEAKTGVATLSLSDAATMGAVNAIADGSTKNFRVAPFSSTAVKWKIVVPENIPGLQYKVVAQSGQFADGEENIIPVLTNNMLVTETIPLWVRENSKKEYVFEQLKSNPSATRRNHQLTLEYTSNPTWLAIESLPYLMEYEHECSEQTFARYYANALAAEIIASNPKISELFNDWKLSGKAPKLDENETLKSILLAETPWFDDAADEKTRKQRLAALFEPDKMEDARKTILEKLRKKQNASGGFSWFDGGPDNEYITRHILSGLGHLQKLAPKTLEEADINPVVSGGIAYIDEAFISRNTQNRTYWYADLHYLYARSFYLGKYPLNDKMKALLQPMLAGIKKEKFNYSLYEKAMAALVLHRFGESAEAKKILVNFIETAASNEENGMYWIANKSGWYWYDSPVETQAMIIEAFSEIGNHRKEVDAMKVWLLKSRQQKNWPTTKATTEAVYALLMTGSDWLSVKDNTVLKIGDEKNMTKKMGESEKEAETGYVKLTWKPEEINPAMATLTIENKSKVPGFGGFYWQYFEDLDKIGTGKSALSVDKTCYRKTVTAEKGTSLEKITTAQPLKIGELVTVRLVISAKDDIEYVHLKDMRASCFEPVDVISGYQWRDRLGYYKSTRDAATHFFFDRISKGTYVLEYDIRVTNAGHFSNGITTIQSMYAPEFSSHTKGIMVNVQQ